MAEAISVGIRIKTYRERLGMSVSDLATKCSVDEKLINSIEEGVVLPAIGMLTKISRALGQRLGTFMDDQFKPDPIITRADDIAAEKIPANAKNELGYKSYSLALGKPDRHMDPFRIEFAAGEPRMPMSSHEGEELIICISGEVELVCGSKTTILKPGDTAYYNSVLKHSLSAVGGKPASIYGVVFMPF